MNIIEIIISIVLIVQFIYLLNRTKSMAVLDDLKTTITELDGSVDSIIVKLTLLQTQLGDSVLAADLQVEIARLQALKLKLDNAQQ